MIIRNILTCLDGPPSPDDDDSSPPPHHSASTTANVSSAAGGNGELAEDMLQMALRMASEMSEEPMLDLEDNVDAAPVRRGIVGVTLL
jgi:hypothetical protein